VRARWAKKGAHEVNEDAQWESCERERHEWVFHEWESHATICALEFAGSGARLATCFKDAHEVRLSPIIAALMATALDEAEGCLASDGRPRLKHDELDVLCYIPATRAAYIRRGFDHMELVAHDLSAMIGLPVADALVKTSSTDQRLLNREDRAHNLKGTIQVVEDVSGAHVVLVDDVITTGATIREATRELLSHGALEVTCCALARAW
jgi:ComF family protein